MPNIFSTIDLETLRLSSRQMLDALDDLEQHLKDPAQVQPPLLMAHQPTGGHPQIEIDTYFLTKAYRTLEPAAITRILSDAGQSVSVRTIRRELLCLNLAEPGPPVMSTTIHPETGLITKVAQPRVSWSTPAVVTDRF